MQHEQHALHVLLVALDRDTHNWQENNRQQLTETKDEEEAPG